MPAQTREQKRAAAAWDCVKDLQGEAAENFATTCKKTSARILTAGLGGALAFLLAKGRDERGDIRVAKQLAKHCKPNSTPESFLQHLTTCDSAELRRHTDEALALLVWMGRLADGKAKQGGVRANNDD